MAKNIYNSKKSFYSRPNTIFFKPKHPRLAEAISIKSPSAFKKSISTVKKMKSFTERQKTSALVLARNRAKAQLKRATLSPKERREFGAIAKMKI